MRSLASLVLFLAAAGCSGDSGLPITPRDLSVRDLSVPPDLSLPQDLVPPPDLALLPPDLTNLRAGDAMVSCADMICESPQLCCAQVGNMSLSLMCGNPCPMGQFPIECDGPEDCIGGTPCCVEIVLVGMMAQARAIGACTARKNDCQPELDFQNLVVRTRRCHSDADCAGTQADKCCTALQGGQGSKVCANQMWAGFSQGRVVCP